MVRENNTNWFSQNTIVRELHFAISHQMFRVVGHFEVLRIKDSVFLWQVNQDNVASETQKQTHYHVPAFSGYYQCM
jgi:hypothetical protein